MSYVVIAASALFVPLLGTMPSKLPPQTGDIDVPFNSTQWAACVPFQSFDEHRNGRTILSGEMGCEELNALQNWKSPRLNVFAQSKQGFFRQRRMCRS